MPKVGDLTVTDYTIQVTDDNPFGEIQEITHDPDCWERHGLCAIKKLRELKTLLEMSKKKVDRNLLLEVIKG